MNTAFFEAHWILSTLFFVFAAALIAVEIVLRRHYAGLSVEAMVQRLNHDRVQCADLREAAAFAQHHIVDAISLPASQWPEAQKRLQGPTQRPAILVCEHGTVSKKWCTFLRQQGHTDVWFLTGGLAAWRQEGLPLVRK